MPEQSKRTARRFRREKDSSTGGSGGSKTRVELADAAYKACIALGRADARAIVDLMLEEIGAALVLGEPVALKPFGRFVVRGKRERVGRNPLTGCEAPISPRRVLVFKPSRSLREAVQHAGVTAELRSPTSICDTDLPWCSANE